LEGGPRIKGLVVKKTQEGGAADNDGFKFRVKTLIAYRKRKLREVIIISRRGNCVTFPVMDEQLVPRVDVENYRQGTKKKKGGGGRTPVRGTSGGGLVWIK